MSTQPPLVLATHNKKKGSELAYLLAPYGLNLRTLDEIPEALEVEETGTTFAENAALKATMQARHLGLWAVGEDSGLAVDALGGRPGIYSARYSGPDATDESNNARLLQDLAGVPLGDRTAHYVCHVALSDPDGNVRVEWEEYCRGRILFTPRGSHGFGYDPLFEIPEYHCTFGQLGGAVKSALSHRSRAMRAVISQLVAVLKCDVEHSRQVRE
jgi:XTP/dITP diphosphohydrolase